MRRRVRERGLAALNGAALGAIAAGDYAEAGAIVARGLRSAGSSESPAAAALHNAAGMVGKYTGDFTGAAQHYARAREILSSQQPAPHAELATIDHNLAGLAHSRGDLDEALEHATAALERRMATGGRAADLAAERAQLATILSELGRHADALRAIDEALIAFADPVSGDVLELAVAQSTRGAVLHRMGQLAHAEEAYTAGLRLREELVGPEHPELAPVLINLARLAEQRAQPEESARLLLRAVGVMAPHVAADHPRLIVARERLAALGASA